MSVLGDLFLAALEASATVEPSSERSIVLTFGAGALGLLVTIVWLLTTSADPVRQPAWGFAVLAGSILCGAGGLLVSVLHLRRVPSDRPLALVCLTLNVAAVAVPMVWMFAH